MTAVLLDDGGLLIGRGPVPGVRAQAQERDPLLGGHGHVVRLEPLGVEEHADLRPAQVGVDQIQIGRVADWGGRALLGGAQPLGIAHLDDADIAFQQPFDHQFGQLGREAIAHYIGSVPKCTVHYPHVSSHSISTVLCAIVLYPKYKKPAKM